jgi:hypothetical protein
MVPPILKNMSMVPLHKAAKPSEKTRVDVTNKLMINSIPLKTNIAYLVKIVRIARQTITQCGDKTHVREHTSKTHHHVAINFRDEPPQYRSER